MQEQLKIFIFIFFVCVYEQVKVAGPVVNKGCIIEPVDHRDSSEPDKVRIRGFKMNKVQQLEKTYNEPGKFTLQD